MNEIKLPTQLFASCNKYERLTLITLILLTNGKDEIKMTMQAIADASEIGICNVRKALSTLHLNGIITVESCGAFSGKNTNKYKFNEDWQDRVIERRNSDNRLVSYL